MILDRRMMKSIEIIEPYRSHQTRRTHLHNQVSYHKIWTPEYNRPWMHIKNFPLLYDSRDLQKLKQLHLQVKMLGLETPSIKSRCKRTKQKWTLGYGRRQTIVLLQRKQRPQNHRSYNCRCLIFIKI